MHRHLTLWLMLLIYSSITLLPAQAGIRQQCRGTSSGRKALVIGNAEYPGGNFPRLPNPQNNAAGMAERLCQYGFAVTRGVDLQSGQMQSAINNFANSLRRGDVALVYYGGHGTVATCWNGQQENFLIPVGKVLRSRADVCTYATSAQWVLRRLNEKRRNGMNIVLLDACRTSTTQGSEQAGLVQMQQAGSFIGYASSPGTVSYGDLRGTYSVFTQQMLNALQPPYDQLPLEFWFRQIRTTTVTTMQKEGKNQIPSSENGLLGSKYFCFRQPCRIDDSAENERLAAEIRRLREELEHQRVVRQPTPAPTAKIRRLREQLAHQQMVHLPAPAPTAKIRRLREELEHQRVVRQPTPAPSAPTTRHGRYLLSAAGVATDTETGLMWQRCAVGKTWTGSTCSGDGTDITWDAAMPGGQQKRWPAFAGYQDWRVPDIKELRTLVYCSSGKPKTWSNSCQGTYQSPAIDQTTFPNTEVTRFWSAAPSGAYSARYINFDNGTDSNYSQSGPFQVRLVRTP